MQYANVIVNHKAGYAPFTYAIPAPLLAHLAVGSVVLVPVGKQTVHGVVESFARGVSSSLAPKLKPIASVVYEGPFVLPYVLSAAKDLHTHFSYGLNDTLFSFLPEFPKRTQPTPSLLPVPKGTYRLVEAFLDVHSRPGAYKKLADGLAERGQSLLIIFNSVSALEACAQALENYHASFTICPPSSEIKARREYFLDMLTTEPKIVLGTRGALVTPLAKIGAVVIDEPWLPGHKEENTPKLWSCIAAHALCKARGIPLHLVCATSWPETRLLDTPYTVHSPASEDPPIRLLPKRPLHEVVTQFLAEHEEGCAIFVHESKYEVLWCNHCKKVVSDANRCPKCGNEPMLLPRLTKELVAQTVAEREDAPAVTIFSSEEVLRYRTFSAALIINFDVYLAVADFRATHYLRTLLGIIKTQADRVNLVTAHPDEWTAIIAHTDSESELAERKEHLLPPFSWAVQLSAKEKPILEKLLPITGDFVLRVGKIQKKRDDYCLSLLITKQAKLPEPWHKASGLKVDFLPNYIE